MPSPVLDTDLNGRAGAHSVQVLPLRPKFPLELSCGQLEDHTAPGQELPAAGGSGDRLRRCSQLEMSRYKTGSLQDYSGLEKEPSVVWRF